MHLTDAGDDDDLRWDMDVAIGLSPKTFYFLSLLAEKDGFISMTPYELRFSGIGRLYGQKAWGLLRKSHIAIVGIGGVGSWAAEAIARSGVERVSLIDLDEICITNTNRQLHALHDTVGQAKVSVMADRLRAINPDLEVLTICDFFTAQTAPKFFDSPYDLIIDAIDSLQNKCLLIAHCYQHKIPLVTVGGAGGRIDPTQIRCEDLNQSRHDALLRQVRRQLRTRYQIPSEGALGIPTVFSLESPVFPQADGEVCSTREEGMNLRLDCESGYGSSSCVTGAFGFAAAAAGLKLLAMRATQSAPIS